MYPIHRYNLCRLCLFVGDQLVNIFEENDSIDFVAHEAIEDLLQFKKIAMIYHSNLPPLPPGDLQPLLLQRQQAPYTTAFLPHLQQSQSIPSLGGGTPFPPQDILRIPTFNVVEEAGLPWLVCSSCLAKLTDFRLFKNRCIECKVTFEQRYLHAEESNAVEIKPEELQIKEEGYEDSVDRDGIREEEEEGGGGRESAGEMDQEEEPEEEEPEEYVTDEPNPPHMECQTADDFVKTEMIQDDEGSMQESFMAGDVVEVKVEEVHVDDEGGQTRVEAESIVCGGVEPRGHPTVGGNRLTVCDGSAELDDRGGSAQGGAKEDFMCAVCEEIFLDMHSLRGHLPCSSSSGVTLAAADHHLDGFGAARRGHWDGVGLLDGGGGGGEEYAVTERVEAESSACAPGFAPGGNPPHPQSANSRRGRGGGGVARGVRGRRPGLVARPRNVKGVPIVGGPKLSDNFTIDKKVSFQCDMCRHGFPRLDLLKKHIQSHSEEGGYACPICRKSFRTRWSLKNHRKSHQKVSQYECPICGRKFSRPQHLEAHRATHGTGTEYQCGICRKTFPQSSYLEMHLRTHAGQDATQCHICGKRFSNANVLKVHLRVHMDIKPFKCELCEMRFAHKAELKQHNLYPCESAEPGTHSIQRGSHRCHLCGDTFPDDGALSRHVEVQHGEVRSKGFKPDPDLPSHSMSASQRNSADSGEPRLSSVPKLRAGGVVPRESLNTGMSYEEEEESLRFKTSPDSDSEAEAKASVDQDPDFVPGLTSDESASTSDATYRPPELGSADRPGESGAGTKVRPYKCQICHKCFGEKWELNSHHRLHTQSNPHACSVCGKRFTETVNLRKHMLAHVDSRPFECPFCAKPFTLRKNLKRHLELESCLKRLDFNASELGPAGGVAQGSRDGPASNPNKCSGADGEASTGENKPGSSRTLDDIMAAAKEASVEVYLEQEGSVSRVFPCTFCEKTFLRTDQLKKHLMVHGGIKPHACTLCSRRFTEKGNLSKHMKTHAYEKPYPCKFCEKAYTQKKNLERHLLSHQSDDESAG